jgi:hypothetical protein
MISSEALTLFLLSRKAVLFDAVVTSVHYISRIASEDGALFARSTNDRILPEPSQLNVYTENRCLLLHFTPASSVFQTVFFSLAPC